MEIIILVYRLIGNIIQNATCVTNISKNLVMYFGINKLKVIQVHGTQENKLKPILNQTIQIMRFNLLLLTTIKQKLDKNK